MAKPHLKNLPLRISPTQFMSASEYLLAVYQMLKREVPRYGVERFSDDLGFGPNNIAYLLAHGKRPFTKKSALSIIQALGLTHLDRRYFLQLVAAQKKTSTTELTESYERLVNLKSEALPKSLDRRFLEFYNHWYNIAILSLLDLPEALDDPEWISAQLRPSVPPSKVKKSLALLKKLGHVVFDSEKKRLLPSQKVLDTGPQVLGLAIIRYHQQMIGLGLDAVTQVSPEEREVTAMTLSIPSHALPVIREKVHALQKELSSLSLRESNPDTVTQINIQVFPLTRAKVRKG
jgi:uncharacterized protein (TIGR02147 family)